MLCLLKRQLIKINVQKQSNVFLCINKDTQKHVSLPPTQRVQSVIRWSRNDSLPVTADGALLLWLCQLMWRGNPLTHTLSTTFQNIIISWIIHSFICHLMSFIHTPSSNLSIHSMILRRRSFLVSFIHTFSLISINPFITSFIPCVIVIYPYIQFDINQFIHHFIHSLCHLSIHSV